MSNIGNKETMSKNLLYYQQLSGKSQKELADIVGVSPSTFNEWIKGKKYPRIDKIEILAKYFGILKSDLIEENPKNTTNNSNFLTVHGFEKDLVISYRNADELDKTIVRRTLKLDTSTTKQKNA